MTTLRIPKGEQGKIRVFAINRPAGEIAARVQHAEQANLVRELLGEDVAENAFEVVALSDLTGVGLPRYLTEGHGIPAEQLTADHARLEALDGYALLLFPQAFEGLPQAFEGRETTLTPGSDVTLIGTYGEPPADLRQERITSDAAQPYTGVPRATPPQPPRGAPGKSMLVAGLLVLIALIIWWLL